jgi:xylulokinase
MRFLIGVDIGTQGSKGALISESGQIVASCSLEQEVSVPRPGWAEHDADVAWWHAFVDVVKGLLARSQIDPGDVSAIGVSSLMPVMVAVDADERPLRPAILYSDTRAHTEMGRMNRELSLNGKVEAGGQFSAGLTLQDLGPKIVWYQQHEPERWQRTRAILGAQAYVVAKLTGRQVIDANTAIGFRPFFDPASRSWDTLTCARYDVPLEMLPQIIEMTDIAGTVTPRAAAATGLAAGTPVIAGAIDFFSEMISTGANEAGDVVVSYGTTLCLAAFSDEPIGPCPGLGTILTDGSAFSELYPGLNSVGGGMVTSAALSRWFRDKFGQAERRAEEELGISAYGLLGLEADAVPPGSDGLVVLPYFSGERTPIHDDQARGMIFGLTLAHGRGHIYRALLEGVAYGVEHHMQLIREAGVPVRRIVATGGGSRSHLWTQIVSDVTGLPQVVIAPSNAALGVAFLAGRAAGIFDRVSDVRRWAKPEREVQPRENVHDVYQKYYAVYRRLYERTKEEMHELARLTAETPSGPLPPLGPALTVRTS